MQVSAIGFNRYNRSFGSDQYYEYNYDGVEAPEDAKSLKKVARVLDDNGGTSRVTSPGKFFLSSAAVAIAGFLVAKSACGGAINKLDSKFGMVENLGKRTADAIAVYVEKHPHKEGKGFGIYFSNKMRDFAQGIIEYGKKGLAKEVLETGDQAVIAAKATGQAIKQAGSNVLGLGVAGATLQSRYEDKDKNGVPDKAEGAISTIKEVATLVPALVDAAGL